MLLKYTGGRMVELVDTTDSKSVEETRPSSSLGTTTRNNFFTEKNSQKKIYRKRY